MAEDKIHPNKEIRAAIEYAKEHGWKFKPGGKSAHCFGRLSCKFPEHREHQLSIWSTPKSPSNHARQIKRMVDRCKG